MRLITVADSYFFFVPSSRQMNISSLSFLVNGQAQKESLVVQWLKRLSGIWEVMGSVPVGDSDLPAITSAIKKIYLKNNMLREGHLAKNKFIRQNSLCPTCFKTLISRLFWVRLS